MRRILTVNIMILLIFASASNWMDVKLGGYNCSNPCIYGAKFKWDEADLDFSWASLETIVKVIETSEMLSAYAAMIKICVQKFMEDDDYFNTKHPVPSECFIGSTVGFWDM